MDHALAEIPHSNELTLRSSCNRAHLSHEFRTIAALRRTTPAGCNVDLDIVSRVSLDGLVQAFGEDAIVLYVGGEGRSYEAHLELAYRHPARTAERAITRFVRLIKRRMISGRLPHDRARPSNASPGGDGPGAG